MPLKQTNPSLLDLSTILLEVDPHPTPAQYIYTHTNTHAHMNVIPAVLHIAIYT